MTNYFFLAEGKWNSYARKVSLTELGAWSPFSLIQLTHPHKIVEEFTFINQDDCLYNLIHCFSHNCQHVCLVAFCYLLFSFYFTSVLTIRVYIADGVNFFHIILLVSMFQLRKHPGYLWPAKQRLTITFSLISRAMVKVSLNWINRYTAQVPTVCNLDSTT